MVTEIWEDEYITRRDKAAREPGFFRDPAVVARQNQSIAFEPKPGRTVSARVFPNGEFGVGFVPPKGISAKDRKYEQDRRYAADNAEIVADVVISEDGQSFTYTRKIIPGFPPPKLGIGSKSSQPTVRYGLKGITSYGRKILRNAGYVLDVSCEGRYNRLPQMGTLTVPSYSEDTMRRICQHWGDIVRKFFQRCKRIYARYRYRFDYASCTEIQPQRWRERREVGLHIHFLFVAIRLGKNKWALPDNTVREIWGDILQSYLGAGESPQLPNYRRETVRYSSGAYLAKYASKGDDSVIEVLEEKGEDYLPHQWWSISNDIRKCIKNNTISSQSTLADMLLCICSNGIEEYYKYLRCITLQTGINDYAKAHNAPEEIVLGYGGLLSPAGCTLAQPPTMCEDIKGHLGRTLDKSSPLVTR